MSAILEFKALQQFETHINGFLQPESPNFDQKHAVLSSIEAEIITFLPRKAATLGFLPSQPSHEYFNVAPLPELIVRPQRPLIPKMVFYPFCNGNSVNRPHYKEICNSHRFQTFTDFPFRIVHKHVYKIETCL